MGGLGIRRFVDINSALLAKLGWKIATREDSLYIRMLRARYLRNQSLQKESWNLSGLEKNSQF